MEDSVFEMESGSYIDWGIYMTPISKTESAIDWNLAFPECPKNRTNFPHSSLMAGSISGFVSKEREVSFSVRPLRIEKCAACSNILPTLLRASGSTRCWAKLSENPAFVTKPFGYKSRVLRRTRWKTCSAMQLLINSVRVRVDEQSHSPTLRVLRQCASEHRWLVFGLNGIWPAVARMNSSMDVILLLRARRSISTHWSSKPSRWLSSGRSDYLWP